MTPYNDQQVNPSIRYHHFSIPIAVNGRLAIALLSCDLLRSNSAREYIIIGEH